MKARLERLTPIQRATVVGWATEAKAAGVGYSLGDRPSVRRFEIVRAAFELAEACITTSVQLYGDDSVLDTELEVVRCLIHGANRWLYSPTQTFKIGYALGRLTIGEAQRLGTLAQAFANGVVSLSYATGRAVVDVGAL